MERIIAKWEGLYDRIIRSDNYSMDPLPFDTDDNISISRRYIECLYKEDPQLLKEIKENPKCYPMVDKYNTLESIDREIERCKPLRIKYKGTKRFDHYKNKIRALVGKKMLKKTKDITSSLTKMLCEAEESKIFQDNENYLNGRAHALMRYLMVFDFLKSIHSK